MGCWRDTRQLYIVLFLHQTTTYRSCWSVWYSLYIVLFLHQTTTLVYLSKNLICCISYYSYIKPQLTFSVITVQISCISYYSYIKPQLEGWMVIILLVVYRTIPTSNHNLISKRIPVYKLYIVLFLHQTTTGRAEWFINRKLYIVLFLHQTTTYNVDIADKQHVTITFINKKWQSRK